MRVELLDFMRREGIRGTRSLGQLLDTLAEEGERDLVAGVEEKMDENGFLDSTRIDSLLGVLGEEEDEEEAEEA